ncbi:hypothetical protein ACFOEE_12155 [Pseudoalteromonas fenneropenaei]|uniref:Bacteriocin n=1 Tax=Pseudoalteromonas fenneropenaei TaxID=1737459 RepID=A0ABV7CKY4_9GAMM
MKLQLNKKSIKALSQDKSAIPAGMTPQVAGGALTRYRCFSLADFDCYTGNRNSCPEHTCQIP